MTEIQFANDFIRNDLPVTEAVEKALQISVAVAPYVHRLEVGTPLVKLGGIETVSALKDRVKHLYTNTTSAQMFLNPTIVVDMKTLDGGCAEALMAANEGAQVIMISGHASNETIKEARLWANHEGVRVMVELDTELQDPVKRAIQVTRMGVEEIEFHVGIDLQRKGRSAYSTRAIRLLNKLNKVNKLAVAGGTNPERVKQLIRKVDVPIIVCGGYIYRANNPIDAVKEIQDAIYGTGGS